MRVRKHNFVTSYFYHRYKYIKKTNIIPEIVCRQISYYLVLTSKLRRKSNTGNQSGQRDNITYINERPRNILSQTQR